MNHPNIIKLLSSNDDETNPEEVLEFVKNGDVIDVINKTDQAFNEKFGRLFLKQIGDAICYLIKKNVYLFDIKCENIVVKFDGKHLIYKLIDFGSAKQLSYGKSINYFQGTKKY